MVQKRTIRGLARDRHGRGIRRPLLSKLFRPGDTRLGDFERAAHETTRYLQQNWPEQLGSVKTIVLNSPPTIEEPVQRWAISKPKNAIYLYRIPIEQFDVRQAGWDRVTQIELSIFEAAGALIDVDPRDFMAAEDE